MKKKKAGRHNEQRFKEQKIFSLDVANQTQDKGVARIPRFQRVSIYSVLTSGSNLIVHERMNCVSEIFSSFPFRTESAYHYIQRYRTDQNYIYIFVLQMQDKKYFALCYAYVSEIIFIKIFALQKLLYFPSFSTTL